jgi:hypothetical protein
MESYLHDYAVVMGSHKGGFVCPLTMRDCAPHEISMGHVVNEALPYQHNVIVPVYGRIDHFYGSRVEEPFIKFLRLGTTASLDFLLAQKELDITFTEGGPTFKAFVVPEPDVEAKRIHLPVLLFSWQGSPLYFGIKTERDDKRVPNELDARNVAVEWVSRFLPAHWVATMLKMAHLTMFYLVGYKLLNDPCADSVRRTLVRYFDDSARREDAPEYFRPFLNSVKIAQAGLKFSTENPATDLDTLRDKKFVFHCSGSTLFAITLFYKFEMVTLTVTVPQCPAGTDIAVASRLYDRLMDGDPDLKPTAVLARLESGRWIHEGKINLAYDSR